MSVAEPRDLIDVLSRMEYWRQEPPVERKRAFNRFSIRGEARIEPVHELAVEPSPQKVVLRDISRGGVGFLSEQFLEVGSVWRMAFATRGRQIGTQVFVVRFCRLVQDGLFLVGGVFAVEPHVMIMLGVNETELGSDIYDRANAEDTAAFVPPDQLED
jgi:hypothetical protein